MAEETTPKVLVVTVAYLPALIVVALVVFGIYSVFFKASVSPSDQDFDRIVEDLEKLIEVKYDSSFTPLVLGSEPFKFVVYPESSPSAQQLCGGKSCVCKFVGTNSGKCRILSGVASACSLDGSVACGLEYGIFDVTSNEKVVLSRVSGDLSVSQV